MKPKFQVHEVISYKSCPSFQLEIQNITDTEYITNNGIIPIKNDSRLQSHGTYTFRVFDHLTQHTIEKMCTIFKG